MADVRISAILDTSVLIHFINQRIAHPVLSIDIGKPLIHLSAVVLAELYAGAFDSPTIKLLDKLYKTFHDVNRVIIPSSSDWQTAGKVIAKLGGKYGYEDRFLSKIQNDVLIAL